MSFLKRIRDRTNNRELAKLKAEYDELIKITATFKETSSYYVDRQIALKRRIAEIEHMLEADK